MTDRRRSLRVLPDAGALARAAADEVLRAAQAANDRFTLALSGGSTPKLLYQRLAGADFAARLDWPRVHLFWGDERCVPPDDPASNYRLARETLLDHLSIPPANVYRISGEREPAQAAADYDRRLRGFFGGLPRFDLILLGLGDDGHTASLFPHTPVLTERDRYAASSTAPVPPIHRVTLTLPVINAAARVLFLVSGEGKAAILRRVLEDEYPDTLPAQLIQPADGEVIWLVDESAARLLSH